MRAAYRLWLLTAHANWRRFRRDLSRTDAVQDALLKDCLAQNAGSLFGREHGFDRIGSWEEYRRRVPIRTYDELQPLIEQAAAGRPALTAARVRLFEPSSGTASATKLIPYTARLQREFSRAIDPWICDLYRTRPELGEGPAYWSVSPAAGHGRTSGGIPIGFDDDASYVGGLAQALVRQIMAVPASVRHVADTAAFRRETLRYLSARPDLRLISVWHPSFLELLLDALPPDVQWRDLWPNLALVSCWMDGPAAPAAAALQARMPGVAFQAKGLLATEGVVSIPFQGETVLALRSHVFEFVDDDGRVWRATEVKPGHEYRVVLTTGGGLYRYDLQDRVRVTGWLASAPCLTFLGKEGHVSDLRGEKLHEAFVATVLARCVPHAAFAMLAPDGPGYTLFLEATHAPPDLAERVDAALCDNFHYRYARDLGQLQPVRVYRTYGARAAVEARLAQEGRRLGDIKPAALSRHDGWTAWLPGG